MSPPLARATTSAQRSKGGRPQPADEPPRSCRGAAEEPPSGRRRVPTISSAITPDETDLDDHRLAAALAAEAGELLLGLRNRGRLLGWSPWQLEDQGDLEAHHLLLDRLGETRPGDAVLSEEGRDDPGRLAADRVWIVDPLDGSHDFSGYSQDYAVHVALVSGGRPLAGAVAVPELGQVFATDDDPVDDPGREAPVIIAGRTQARWAMALAHVLGGEAMIAGSAGVKAMAVVGGHADVYLHASGLYEWDVCAPAAVAQAAGMAACDIDGEPITYNKDEPVVRGLIVSRPRFLEPVLDTLS